MQDSPTRFVVYLVTYVVVSPSTGAICVVAGKSDVLYGSFTAGGVLQSQHSVGRCRKMHSTTDDPTSKMCPFFRGWTGSNVRAFAQLFLEDRCIFVSISLHSVQDENCVPAA